MILDCDIIDVQHYSSILSSLFCCCRLPQYILFVVNIICEQGEEETLESKKYLTENYFRFFLPHQHLTQIMKLKIRSKENW